MAEALGTLHHDQALPKPPRSSFFLPMWFMPPARRHALHTLYDFCRCVDDAVDEAISAKEALDGLHHWQQELHDIYHGVPFHPAARGFQKTVREYAIPEDVLLEMMKGFETDAIETLALETERELETYCFRVAGCVGIASLPIFGVSIDAYTPFAVTLGHALQLTNILRDLDEDLMRGRCYLPAELLARYGISAADADGDSNINVSSIDDATLASRRENAAFGSAFDTDSKANRYKTAWNKAGAELAYRAEQYFNKTHALVSPSATRRLIPALLMRDGYHLLLDRMRTSGSYFRKAQKIRRRSDDVLKLLGHALRYAI